IKVDREERPDLDKIYQLAHQLMTRRPGGWPLTMVLAPDTHTPFFAGTYFPPEPRHGMPAFSEVLVQVERWFRGNRDSLATHHDEVVRALSSIESTSLHQAALDDAPLREARSQLEALFDERLGGFGDAPKFPHPTNLARLLRHYTRHRDDSRALHMLQFTLTRMAEGGLYDQVGGGFCRYSVDDQWMIPHFEKMLYDNAPLLELYSEAYALTGDPGFARTARGTAEFVMRELQSDAGGYFSTLDADSEGEEGRFYVWSVEEVRSLLDTPTFELLAARYGLDGPANFERHHWHLHTRASLDELAERFSLDTTGVQQTIDDGLARLFQARSERVRPGLDDKILTAWNGLMIQAMAVAADRLQEPRYLDSAQRGLRFVVENLWHDGRLLATHKDGRSHLNAYLDDYALLASAILAVLQRRFDGGQMRMLLDLCEAMLTHFEDGTDGGFFFTSHDHESLLHRSKPFMDDALPAGNGIAALVLLRVGHLLGETRFIDAAERCLRAGWASMSRVPHAHNALLDALEELLYPPQSIIIRGDDPQELERWRERAMLDVVPGRVVLAIGAEEQALPGLLALREPGTSTRAYICRGQVCDAPVQDFEQFSQALDR
ncbi:MAG: thioredoxin domain-containing protein, partial [Gammaproteobacteria bacterium]|nr:thioredoxin domain-containing protein [Gammaproteobacteria bacterium]